MMPERIQRSRKKGARMPKGAVYVGRPTVWGNPFKDHSMGVEWSVELYERAIIGPRADAEIGEEAEAMFYAYAEKVTGDPNGLNWYYNAQHIRDELGGKSLACWCPLEDEGGNPVPCHADVLLELANTPERT